jgi:hypothetical protein
MIQWLHYKLLRLFNFWRACNVPKWIDNILSKGSDLKANKGGTLYFRGKIYRYKVYEVKSGNGYRVKCYRKFRNHILREKSRLTQSQVYKKPKKKPLCWYYKPNYKSKQCAAAYENFCSDQAAAVAIASGNGTLISGDYRRSSSVGFYCDYKSEKIYCPYE